MSVLQGHPISKLRLPDGVGALQLAVPCISFAGRMEAERRVDSKHHRWLDPISIEHPLEVRWIAWNGVWMHAALFWEETVGDSD